MNRKWLAPSILALSVWLSVSAVNAGTDCVLTSKITNADEASRALFMCDDHTVQFTAKCDLTVDPVEYGFGWLKIDRVGWVVYGANAGIESSYGFIICEKMK